MSNLNAEIITEALLEADDLSSKEKDVKNEVQEDVFIDPGQLEGKPKKDPLIEQNNITPESPRFQEVYGKMKEFERKLKENEAKESETKKLIEEMRRHNKELMNSFTSTMKDVSSALIEDDVKDEITSIEGKINALKEAKQSALNDLDYAKAESIGEEILDLKLELRELKKEKGNKTSKTQVDSGDKKIIQQVAEPFVKFIEENKWYTEDPIAQGAAIAIDALLVKDPVWNQKPVEERLAEVQRRIYARFPEYAKNGTKKETKPGGVDMSETQSRRDISVETLTPDEKAIAKAFGMTEAEYAKQLAQIRAAKRRR